MERISQSRLRLGLERLVDALGRHGIDAREWHLARTAPGGGRAYYNIEAPTVGVGGGVWHPLGPGWVGARAAWDGMQQMARALEFVSERWPAPEARGLCSD